MIKDPTEKYQTRIKNVMKENDVNVNKRTARMNQVAQKFRELVKTLYMETRPMRPVVSRISKFQLMHWHLFVLEGYCFYLLTKGTNL